jgi:Zn-dependent protease with chaperone function
MNPVQFSHLVQKLEVFAKEQPSAYKFRVRLLALLGYGYIFLVLGLIIAGSVVFIPKLFDLLGQVRNGRAMLLILLFGIGTPLVLIYSVINALWFRIPAPNGFELHLSQSPRLYQLLRDLKGELRTVPVHRVLLTDEFNAAVAQVPRFGIFGGYRNYLIIGLPLLQSLSPGQFQAVIAHELGHLCGKHGQFGHWIYRIRRSWYQLLAGLEQTAPQQANNAFSAMLAFASMLGRGIFVTFFQWYTPFFSAYSFVLARADEYEADRYAASSAGPNNLAAALTNITIKGRHSLPAFWQNLAAQVSSEGEPPAPYSALSAQMQQTLPDETAQTWLQAALKQQTDLEDTHPCLRERLQQLGCNPEKAVGFLKPIRVTAASHFLDQALPQILAHFNEEWQASVRPAWREQYIHRQRLQKQLTSLEQHQHEGDLPTADRWQRAKLTAELNGAAAAVPDLQQVLAEDPHHTGAHALLGQYLLEQGDRTGLKHIEQVMPQNVDSFEWGAKLIFAFIKEQDGEATAHQYWNETRPRAELLWQAKQERSHVTHHHSFVLPDLIPDTREALASQLSCHNEIKAAYLVQKVVQHLPESPLYVLALELQDQSSSRREISPQWLTALMDDLQMSGETVLILLDSDHTALKVKLRKMEGAALF